MWVYSVPMKYLYPLVLVVLVLSLAWIIFAASRSEGTIPRDNGGSAMANNANHKTFTLSSTAFSEGGTIPVTYTCDGDGAVHPPLSISNPPDGTKSFVLIMHDPDIPQQIKEERGIDEFDHWVVYGIPAGVREIPEGEGVGGAGLNGAEGEGYRGPCPPPDMEPTTHRYVFTLYALKGNLQFIKAPTRAEVEAAMQGMVLDEAQLTGLYDRSVKTN